MNLIVRMQGEICTDLLDIKSNTKFMFEFVTTLISSSMDEILNIFREKSKANIVRNYEPIDEVSN